MQGVDARAAVHPDARLAPGVSIGPFSVIGPHVSLGEGTWVGPNVSIDGHTTIGARNRFYPYCSIGLPPQDFRYQGGPTRLEIGDDNVFREGCTIHRGSEHGGAVTRIGSHCYFMVQSHVGHDGQIGNHVLFVNAGTLAGHVEVADHATVGAFSAVHQFSRVGPHAFIGGGSILTRDALPYCTSVGNRALCYGVNRIGLKRKGFSSETILTLDQAVRTLFRPSFGREQALAEIEARWGGLAEVQVLLEFVRSSKRGVIPMRRADAAEEP
ncbi:MAG: acyl-ACP--UDP-N-acetylglucosamine O-acyltransferase [Acidobacteria bacterium]|nr:acyl-ACP--UDP-N-acetylglucosamine O-acyltransferase [Acidobacteriota bacterium]